MTSFPSFPPPPPLLPAAIVARRRLYLQAICARGSRGKKSENNARVLIIPSACPRVPLSSSSLTSPRRSSSARGPSEGPPRRRAPCVRCLTPLPLSLSSPQKCVPVRCMPAHSCAITCRDPLWYLCARVCLSRAPLALPEIESEETGKEAPQNALAL